MEIAIVFLIITSISKENNIDIVSSITNTIKDNKGINNLEKTLYVINSNLKFFRCVTFSKKDKKNKNDKKRLIIMKIKSIFPPLPTFKLALNFTNP
jgi:hypothetical protein